MNVFKLGVTPHSTVIIGLQETIFYPYVHLKPEKDILLCIC